MGVLGRDRSPSSPSPWYCPGCSPMTSEVGTDLRAVRPHGTGCRECLPWRVPHLCHVHRSGAFGEIALPRRWQRGLRARKAGSGKSVGTVSHRPLFGLPGEQGMARETRSLPGRFMGEAEFAEEPRPYSPMTSEVGTDLRAVRPHGTLRQESVRSNRSRVRKRGGRESNLILGFHSTPWSPI